jgi:hypothetical protein
MAAGAITKETKRLFLDPIFHLSARTVNLIVELLRATFQIGQNITRISTFERVSHEWLEQALLDGTHKSYVPRSGEAQRPNMDRWRTIGRQLRRLGEIRRLFVCDLLLRAISTVPSPSETGRDLQEK